MGYYSNFKVEVTTTDQKPVDNIEQVLNPEVFERYTGYTQFTYDYHDALILAEAKWYRYEKDMRKMSNDYPDLLFKVIVEGEESYDMYVVYFCRGKMQQCNAIITYPPYDETKLK
jgi:hypothetical protein